MTSEQSDTATEHSWKFEVGESLVKQEDSMPQMPGVGRLADPIEYTVERRLIDPDSGEQLYYLEWVEDAPTDALGDESVENMLYTETVVESHYRRADDAE